MLQLLLLKAIENTTELSISGLLQHNCLMRTLLTTVCISYRNKQFNYRMTHASIQWVCPTSMQTVISIICFTFMLSPLK